MAVDNNQLEAYLKQIHGGAQYGSYGEGEIGSASNVLRQLSQQLASGQITPEDYRAYAGSFVQDSRNKLTQISGSGQKQAEAARNAGGDQFQHDARTYDVYNIGRQLLGRDLTTNEAAQALPSFLGPGGEDTGRAYLAQLAQADANNPTSLRAKSGEHSGDVNRLFTELLGRGSNADENQYYGGLLAGKTSPYELRQYLQALPEYQNAEDSKFRSGLNSELASYDQEAFGRQKEDVISRYTRAGIQNSPALDFALTNLMGDIAKERGKYLAGVSSQQYGANKSAARDDYKGYMDNYLNNQNYERNLRDTRSDAYTDRGFAGQDYEIQRNDYMNLLGGQNRRRSGDIGQLIGTVAGGGLGAYFGGPAGAQAGSSIGGAAGGGYDYYNY